MNTPRPIFDVIDERRAKIPKTPTARPTPDANGWIHSPDGRSHFNTKVLEDCLAPIHWPVLERAGW